MAYLNNDELKELGFKHLGKGVKISDKASIYNADEIEIGDYSRVDDFCILSGHISIGKHVHITPMNLVAGGQKGVFIDDFCALAYNCKVFSQTDDYTGKTMTNSTVPKAYKSEIIDTVHIGKHVIVGAGSVIMPGVHVTEGCSIGAMTLVQKSTEPWGIYCGIPARRLKDRKKDLLTLEKKFLKEKHDSL